MTTSRLVWEKIGDCLYILFLLTLIMGGWILGDSLGAWLEMANFLILPWMEMVFHQEPAKPKNAVNKMGSVIPVEEDHNLRKFTILNAEGEIYEIDTSLEGPFYGPTWTKILSCYENRKTLRGRLVKAVYDESGKITGYHVRIGKIKTFLPASQAMKSANENPINLCVAVTHVDPITRNVNVSARQAYTLLFARKSMPQVGEDADALYWDYDEEHVFLLLSGEYVGQAACHEKEHEIAGKMGSMTRCHIEALNQDTQMAVVSLLSASRSTPVNSVSHVQEENLVLREQDENSLDEANDKDDSKENLLEEHASEKDKDEENDKDFEPMSVDKQMQE